MMRLTFGVSYMTPSPIFNHEIAEMGYCEYEELGLPDDLEAAIKNWDAKYQATLNLSSPADSIFFSLADQIEFNQEGAILYEWLKDALSSNAEIEYRPIVIDRNQFTPPVKTGSVKVGGN